MLTVRFPDGTAVQYNAANYLVHGERVWNLYSNDTKTEWIASIQPSSGAIVERVPACRVYNPSREKPLAEIVADLLERKPCSYDDRMALKRLKAALTQFNAATGRWK